MILRRNFTRTFIINPRSSHHLLDKKTDATFLRPRRLRQNFTILSLTVRSWRLGAFGDDPEFKQPILSRRAHGNDHAVRIDAPRIHQVI
jgi:hypothetical protein